MRPINAQLGLITASHDCHPVDSELRSCSVKVAGKSVSVTLGQSTPLVGTIEEIFTKKKMIPRYDLTFGGLTRGMLERIQGTPTKVEVYVNDDNSGKQYTRFACAAVDKGTRNALIESYRKQ